MTMVTVRATLDGVHTEAFWVEEDEPGRGTVEGVPWTLPIGVHDEVGYEANGDGRLVLTKIITRSSHTTISVTIPNAPEELIAELAYEFADNCWVSSLTSRRQIVLAGDGLTKAMVYDQIADRVAGLTLELVEVCRPTDSVNLPWQALPELKVHPLSVPMVDAYLKRPEVLQRYEVLRMSQDLPESLDPVRILHASVNLAAVDPRLRKAWVDGALDAVWIAGARELDPDSPTYPDSYYNLFTYQASDWPKES